MTDIPHSRRQMNLFAEPVVSQAPKKGASGDRDTIHSRSEAGTVEPEAITVRVPTAIRMLGLSRSKFYLLMADGEFEIIKVGRCTLVVVASLRAFVDRLRN